LEKTVNSFFYLIFSNKHFFSIELTPANGDGDHLFKSPFLKGSVAERNMNDIDENQFTALSLKNSFDSGL
jgi:hypothetical protein